MRQEKKEAQHVKCGWATPSPAQPSQHAHTHDGYEGGYGGAVEQYQH